jgi:chromate reductase, NAD(P)H dehydrogenase (quinone)
VLSLAEHYGNFTAEFKNTFDWISREDAKMFETTPVFLLSTSPGGRGGVSVMNIALDRFPRHGATIPVYFILASFYDNFKNGELANEELLAVLKEKIELFTNSL